MKIKDLDRNEVYDLTEIKKDSVKFDLLKEWLKENDEGWISRFIDALNTSKYIKYNNLKDGWVYGVRLSTPTKCALTLFELDITDYQVDCSELSSEQIEEMAEVVKSKGFDIWNNEKALITDGKNGSNNFFKYDGENYYIGNESNKVTITYDKFIELFGEKELTKEQLIESVSDRIKKETDNYLENLYYSECTIDQGYKESDNKCNYELDFDFIQDLAMRIQNEPKYEPYNWQKPMNVEQLSNAMLRHAIEVKKGNFDDNGELGHLLAIAANAMFIYYQKKHNE